MIKIILEMVPALDFSYTNSTGVFYGVRLGYNIALGSKDAWKNGIDKTHQYLQIIQTHFIHLSLEFWILKKKNNRLQTDKPSVTTKNTNMNTSIVDNNGDKLYTIIYPNPGKETINGGPGFPSDLREVADTLKDRFQVITFPPERNKKSPCANNDYSMEAYLSDIEAVRKIMI